MDFRVIAPAPALCHLVRQYYALDAAASAGIAEPAHIVPDGHLEIGFSFGDPVGELWHPGSTGARWRAKSGGYVDAPMDRHILVRPHGHLGIFAVKLRHGAGRTVFPFGVEALREGPFRLGDVFGSAARRVEERVAVATTDRERADAVDAFLLGLVAEEDRPDRLVSAAARTFRASLGTARVADVADGLGVSRRLLGKRFQACLGVSPKRFAQLTRVRSAIARVAGKPERPLGAVALRHGYVDQSHFIKEFRMIAGLPPTEFFSRPQLVSDLLAEVSGRPQ